MNHPLSVFRNKQYQLFKTGDIDEARCRVSEVYCDHMLSAKKGELNAFHYHLPFSGVSFNYMKYGPESTIEPGYLQNFYLIQLPVKGHARIEVDGNVIDSHPGKASVINPTAYTKMIWSEGCEQLLIQISKQKVREAMSSCLGVPISSELLFDAMMENDNHQHAAWWRHLFSFIEEYSQACSFYQNKDILDNALSNIVKSLLYSLNHNHRERLLSDQKVVMPKHVKMATDYIHDHASENLTIDDLVKLTGVSERCLFEGFKNYQNISPMRFLMKIRLAKVRNELLNSANDQVSVTQIALDNGFTQLGRFSSAYKKVYGELPSETLKKSH